MATYLLDNLNWGQGENGKAGQKDATESVQEGEKEKEAEELSPSMEGGRSNGVGGLFLGSEWHRRVLVMVVEVSCEKAVYAGNIKGGSKNQGSSGGPHGAGRVRSASFINQNQIHEFTTWCWSIMMSTSHFLPTG